MVRRITKRDARPRMCPTPTRAEGAVVDKVQTECEPQRRKREHSTVPRREGATIDTQHRQNINAAQRAAHYARGRRDALQGALRLMQDVKTPDDIKRTLRQLSAMLNTATKEAEQRRTELDAAYEAYNQSIGSR